MRFVLFLLYSYLLGSQILSLFYLVFLWNKPVHTNENEEGIDEISNTVVTQEPKTKSKTDTLVNQNLPPIPDFLPSGYEITVIDLSAYISLIMYLCIMFFHVFITLKYCGITMLLITIVLAYFETLEFFPLLPVVCKFSFPDFASNRVFCILETIVKIGFYITGCIVLKGLLLS